MSPSHDAQAPAAPLAAGAFCCFERAYFVKAQKMHAHDVVTRIGWRFLTVDDEVLSDHAETCEVTQ